MSSPISVSHFISSTRAVRRKCRSLTFCSVCLFSERSVQRVKSWPWSIPASELEARTAHVSGETPDLPQKQKQVTAHHLFHRVCVEPSVFIPLQWYSRTDTDGTLTGHWQDTWCLMSVGEMETKTSCVHETLSVTAKPSCHFFKISKVFAKITHLYKKEECTDGHFVSVIFL